MRIILFDIDCLRPDHLGCYGYDRPTSPTIDSVAGQGMCFDNYFCANSPCLPSRIGFVSGRFGINNGVISNVGAGAAFRIRTRSYSGPNPENEMLMRHLRSAGWDTISFSNFADRHSAPWFMCGWSEFHTPNLKGGGETAEEVNEPLLRWLKTNARRDNYLLHVNYWDAHRYYKMDPCWADPLKDHPVTQSWPDEETIRQQQSMEGSFTARRQFRDGKSPVRLMPDAVTSRKDFEHMINGYDAAIRYVDHHVKMVLDQLDRQGVLDDAIVIFTADHGDAFGEHGIYSDHVCADECIHHIPLIVRWPGLTAPGSRCNDLVYNVDLSTTLSELLAGSVPREWDGMSFAPQLRSRQGSQREYLVWDHGLYTVQRAVRTKRHLMIRTYHPFEYSLDPVELYDLVEDRFQARNLSHAEPDTVKRCQDLLDEWTEQQRARHGTLIDPIEGILAERQS